MTKRLSIRYEVGGGDVARLADRFGDGPLGQRAEQRRTLRFRGRVPHRGVNRSRPDRVDPDRSELNGQPPGQSLDRCGSAGQRAAPADGRTATVPDVSTTEPPALIRGAACLTAVTAPQKRTSNSRRASSSGT